MAQIHPVEFALYSEAWKKMNEGDLIVDLLIKLVRELLPGHTPDTENVKRFLSSYIAQAEASEPPEAKVTKRKKTKPVSFMFNDQLYDKDIEDKPIRHWNKCWIK